MLIPVWFYSLFENQWSSRGEWIHRWRFQYPIRFVIYLSILRASHTHAAYDDIMHIIDRLHCRLICRLNSINLVKVWTRGIKRHLRKFSSTKFFWGMIGHYELTRFANQTHLFGWMIQKDHRQRLTPRWRTTSKNWIFEKLNTVQGNILADFSDRE